MALGKQTLFQKIISENELARSLNNGDFQHSIKVKIVLLFFTVLICSIFFSVHLAKKSDYVTELKMLQDRTWQGKTLTAEFSFPIYKSENELAKEIKDARDNVPDVYTIDNNIRDYCLSYIASLSSALPEMSLQENENSEIQIPEKLIKPFIEQSKAQKEREAQNLKKELTRFLQDIYNRGYVNIPKDKIYKTEIAVHIPPNERVILKKVNLTDRESFQNEFKQIISTRLSALMQPIAVEIINKLVQPNLIFSAELTERAKDLAELSIPRTDGIIRKGEIIIKNKEKLNEQNIAKLESFEKSKLAMNDYTVNFLYYLGAFGQSGLLLSILFIYLLVIRKKIFGDNVQVAILCTIFIFAGLLSWISNEINVELPVEYLVTIPAFSMLAAIVFDSRTAFYVTISMSLMLAGIRGNDYVLATTMVFAGTLAAYTVRDIQSRTQIFRSMFYIFIGLSLPVVIFATERSFGDNFVYHKLLFSAINAVISPLMTFGLLFFIERMSNISTDLRIKEFDNINHPLLQKMSEIAPGTYQHTMGVAVLAERCARELNANPLLCRVGSYFHDIGKMKKPEYFTENQIGIENKHDLIPPKKSAKIIIDHVPDGVEMAKQYKLPQRLIDFIPMHHGTTIVKHFYAKALEEAGDKTINEDDFRYPGPRPNSRETAILMICDSAEAISRIDTKSTEEIENIIEQNIRERILDGQFDNANITLEELNKIKGIIAKSLIGMAHKRVSYKSIPKDVNKETVPEHESRN